MVLALVVAGPAAAQATDEPSSKTFFTRRDGVIAASFLAASVGLSLFDARIAHYFRDTSLAHVRFGDKWDDVGAGLALGALSVHLLSGHGRDERAAVREKGRGRVILAGGLADGLRKLRQAAEGRAR